MDHKRVGFAVEIASNDDVAVVDLVWPGDLDGTSPDLHFDGWAKRMPGDVRDRGLGENLAVLRALRLAVAHLEPLVAEAWVEPTPPPPPPVPAVPARPRRPRPAAPAKRVTP